MSGVFPWMTMTPNKWSSISLLLMSRQKRHDLEDLFRTFDKDHNGKVSQRELEEVLLSTGVEPGSVIPMLSKIAAPKEHYTYAEFAKLFKTTLTAPDNRLTTQKQELCDAFRAFDRNGDGVISTAELWLMMRQLGERITEREAKEMINEVDEDKDGVVDLDEFLHMMGVCTTKSPPPDSRPRRFRQKLKSVFG